MDGSLDAQNVVDNQGCNALSFNRVTPASTVTFMLRSYQAARGINVMKEAAIVRQKQVAELRRMAKTTREAERERKLLALAHEWDEKSQHGLKKREALDSPGR
jgi:hypothetical protein